ncbi:MAG TPA: histidine kinase, partial [Anaerolineae bacterium]
PEAILPALVETIAQTLKLPYVAVTVVKKAEGRRQKAEGGRAHHFAAFSASSEPVEGVKDEVVAGYGPAREKVISLSLVYQGQRVGQLLVAPRAPGEIFSRAEQRLLAQIAHQAAGVVHTVRLNQDLQRARERLVVAREEERRQMRRGLHDGLGAQLASLTLKADAAQRQLANDPETAEALLLELRRDTQQAIHDIRTLVRRLGAAGEEVAP